jgi:peptidylprolyl isomerase
MFAPLLAFLLAAQAAPHHRPAPPPPVTTASGLRFQVLRSGAGARPQPGDAVLVTYVGRLADGTVFDAAAAPVGLPVSGVVPGFSEALQLMNVGGRYRFWIPAALAYGAAGVPGHIPPNAELDFTVTLVRVGAAAPPTATPPAR